MDLFLSFQWISYMNEQKNICKVWSTANFKINESSLFINMQN